MLNKQETQRLVFKRLCANDLDFMLTLTGNPAVVRYLPGMITDKEMMKGWILSLDARDLEFLIVRRDTGVPIGECSMTVQEEGTVWEIGYMLLPDYWNLGYGTETVQWMMEAAREAGIRKLTAMTHEQNEASIHLLKKMGFNQSAVGWMLAGAGSSFRSNQMNCYTLNLKGE